jgi:hypothetical protein
MIFYILLLVLIVSVIGCIRTKGDRYFGVGFITLIVSIFYMVIVHTTPTVVEIEPYVNPISSLKTMGGTSLSGGGSFLGWSISASGTETYVVLHKTTRGYKKRFLDASETYINETDDMEPSVTYRQYDKQYSNKYVYPPWLWNITGNDYYTFSDAVINVPVGTIIHKINKIE